MPLELKSLTPLLQVYDMPTSVGFYRDMLGFTVVITSPVLGPDWFHWALLRLGEAELMLNTAYEFDNQRPTVPDSRRVTAHGDTGLFFSCPNVDDTFEELRSKDVPVKEPKIARYGMKQMYLKDPDGYELCFQWPVEAQNSNAYEEV